MIKGKSLGIREATKSDTGRAKDVAEGHNRKLGGSKYAFTFTTGMPFSRNLVVPKLYPMSLLVSYIHSIEILPKRSTRTTYLRYNSQITKSMYIVYTNL